MEDNRIDDKPFPDSMEELKNEIAESNRKLKYLMILVVLLIVLCGYLCFAVYRSTNATDAVDSTHRVLIVSLESNLSNSDRSDKTQVRNALSGGGKIRIKPTNEDIEYSFGTDYCYYGAGNSDGTFWTTGALLNYIASRGWTFVQAPSSGLTNEYYFVK